MLKRLKEINPFGDGQQDHKPALYDKTLLVSVLLILIIGLVMVASASIVVSEKQFGTPFHYLIRQMLFLILAIVASQFILRIPIEKVQEHSITLFFISVFLLVIVLIPHIGRSVNGSSRWIGIGPFGLQVSEFAKLAVILFLAGYLVRRREEIREHFSGFVKPMVILAVVVMLLLKEPDFGASVVIMVTAMAMMFLAGMRLRYFLLLLLLVAVAMSLIAIASPYRMKRLTSFIDPWANQYGSGYQLTQSLIAFGNGGFFGVGLGNSVQKLFYLPEAYTDFLFAVLAEELGLIGVLVTFSLYSLLVIRSLFIARRAHLQESLFAAYVAYGIGLWLGFQFLVNVGVNAGVLPTKGLTLPFMSYGGSSLLIDCCAVALLFRIDYESRMRNYGMNASMPYRHKRS